MIKFKELTLRNFLSYGNNVTKLKLDFTTPTLLVGKNYDEITNGQVTSNGSGKSTILNSLAVCAYDEPISDIAKSDLVNYINEKNMEVTLVFECDGVHYKISRYRKNKALGGDGVRLFVNPKEAVFEKEHDKTKSSVAETNAEIVKILKLPFTIFSRIVVILASYEPFLSLPSSHASKANQRDIIEELFGLTELTVKAEKLSVVMKALRSELKDLQTRNDRISEERKRQEDQIESAENKMADWVVTNATNIKEIKTKLKSYVAINFDAIEKIITELEAIAQLQADKNQLVNAANRELTAIKENNTSLIRWNVSQLTNIERLEEELSVLEAVDVDYLSDVQAKVAEYSADLITIRRDIKDINKKIDEETDKVTKKENEIYQLNDKQCPYCKQAFHDVEEKRQECQKAIEDINDFIFEVSKPLAKLQKSEAKLVELLEPLKTIKIPSDLKSIASSIIQKKSELDTVRKQVNPFTMKETKPVEKQLQEMNTALYEISEEKKILEENLASHTPEAYGISSWTRVSIQKINSEIDNLADKLETYKKAVNPFESVVDELKKVLATKLEKPDEAKVDKLSELLEHQEFLSKLLTKKDSFVRKALLTKNIPFLNSRLEHYLKLMGLNHKVLFTEEMGVNISKFGTQWSYGNLSGGQKARVNLALSFAFRDVLQARFSKINFCMLDECLDTGLDDVGVGLAAKTIKNVAVSEQLSMLVISHKGEISNLFDSKLEVELRGGFTTVLPHPLLIEVEEAE